MANVSVYVDGFNLYNGCLKRSSFRWLNLYELATVLLPNDTVGKVKYFTAKVQSRVNDPDQHIRQQVYWQALRSVPQIEIIEGHFLTKETLMPEAASVRALQAQATTGVSVVGRSPAMVQVIKTEEKGTDVNLAAHLLHDAHLNRFDTAVVISNDSDLTEAIRLVRRDIGKIVGVYIPHTFSNPSFQLRQNTDFFLRITNGNLRASLFPDPIITGTRRLVKPAGW